jgi:hypothetical protein
VGEGRLRVSGLVEYLGRVQNRPLSWISGNGSEMDVSLKYETLYGVLSAGISLPSLFGIIRHQHAAA